MRKRKSARGVALAIVNVVVILGAAFIVKSLAAGDPARSHSSFSLPAESEFALPSPGARAAISSGGSSSASSPSPAAGQDTSAQIVPPSATGWEEAPPIDHVDFDQLSYLPSHPFAPLVPDSGSWPQLQASATGYGSLSAPSYGRRAGLSGGFSGMGGFPSSGGGGGGRPSNAQSSNSQIDPASAALRSSSGGPTASAAGAPLLPPQAQGNPLFAGGNTLGAPAFPLVQFPGLGSGGAVATGLIVPNLGGGPAANVTQLQQPVSVPEPSTALLVGCGLALAAYRKRRLILPN